MPVKVERRGRKYRVVEPDGSIALTPTGKPRDGGGHVTRNRAIKQVQAINGNVKAGTSSPTHEYIFLTVDDFGITNMELSK